MKAHGQLKQVLIATDLFSSACNRSVVAQHLVHSLHNFKLFKRKKIDKT